MSISLLQISDTHFAGSGGLVNGKDPADRLSRVLTAVRATETLLSAIVITGDLTDDGSRSACRRLAARLRPSSVPVLAVPGNHDDPQAVREIFGSDVLGIGGWRITGIDTSRPAQIHGTVDPAAVAATVEGHDGRPTVLAMHHPPSSPSTHPWFQLDGGDELVRSMTRFPHVRVMLSGHLHHPFELRSSGIDILGCPSSLQAFRHDGAEVFVGDADTTGARICTLHDDGSVTSVTVTA